MQPRRTDWVKRIWPFGELLPEKPTWMEQQDYEERTSVGFHLERLTKGIGDLMPREFGVASRQQAEEP
jgi:hypothetical protein